MLLRLWKTTTFSSQNLPVSPPCSILHQLFDHFSYSCITKWRQSFITTSSLWRDLQTYWLQSAPPFKISPGIHLRNAKRQWSIFILHHRFSTYSRTYLTFCTPFAWQIAVPLGFDDFSIFPSLTSRSCEFSKAISPHLLAISCQTPTCLIPQMISFFASHLGAFRDEKYILLLIFFSRHFSLRKIVAGLWSFFHLR